MSRVIDDRGRLFGKVNVVDIVVLVVILAIVVFAAVRFTGNGTADSVQVRLTLVDSWVDRSLVPALQAKGTLKDSAGNVIGDVQSVQVTPSVQELLTTEGRLQTFTSSTRSDVTFVVLAKGTIFDSTAHIGNMAARVGNEVHIVGPGYEAQTTIVGVVWGTEALK